MYIRSVSNWHDGSMCLLNDGKVQKHVIAERVSHHKHARVGDEDIHYFNKDAPDNIEISVASRLNECHHVYHAAHSFYDSGFRRSLCVVSDGMGCNFPLGLPLFQEGTICRESISVYLVEYPCKFKPIYREVVSHFECDIYINEDDIKVTSIISPGQMYEATCQSIGMNWYDAGKLMAMASYGEDNLQHYNDCFIKTDGTLHKIRLKPEVIADLTTFKEKCNFAKSLQNQTQKRILKVITDSIKKTGCRNVCMGGGYFLNCVANTYIHKNLPRNVNTFIEPSCADDGISIGLAKLRWYEETKSKKRFPLKTIYYGTPQEIDVDGIEVTPNDVAHILADRKVVGIFQSRSESGPRALGNRSILYDPRDPHGRDKINKLKGREDYRPLAATVLHEHAHRWFDMCRLKESPYMLYSLDVLSDKVPAICHVDNTCRVQTLKKSFNEHYYNLIKEFKNITGVPLLLNTSLNLAGDTIAETVEDAMKTLNDSEMDYLYFPEKGILVASSQTGT